MLQIVLFRRKTKAGTILVEFDKFEGKWQEFILKGRGINREKISFWRRVYLLFGN